MTRSLDRKSGSFPKTSKSNDKWSDVTGCLRDALDKLDRDADENGKKVRSQSEAMKDRATAMRQTARTVVLGKR